ncbi:uncharacterized protein ATC70_001588 [Mucor velutinosus]|uniref:Uncharacterized protein n=1 Tax=Mucor velutinosus TaxID=708070 RepID=A0AAN7DIT5_9FUNG|nr:hypothetical protein ATC70_001588 [Mucor velutinosus]
MSSRTSATTNVTILKQKTGGIPSVMVHASSVNSSASSKQPTLSKNTSTQVKVLKSNKRSQHNKQQHQQEQKPQQKSRKSASNVNNNNVVKKACVSAPTTPQQRRTVLPAKARRVERRKEIVSMTEAIKVELDTPSSTESDDSSSSSTSHSSPGGGGGGKKAGKKNHGHSNKQQKKVMPTIINATTSTTIISAESTKKREQQRNRRRSSSAIDVRKSHVYAGPTFNNAPAPSALPMPAFSPTLLSVDLITSTTTTLTAANGKDDLQRHSQDLMNLLSPKPHHREFDSDLSEIQRGLRSMLKI